MGSPIIGRTGCPECGFENAHVKQSEKCLFRYCPECGTQTFAKTARQRELMQAKSRPVVVPQAQAPAVPTPELLPTVGSGSPTGGSPTGGSGSALPRAKPPEKPAPKPAPAPTAGSGTPGPAAPRRGLFTL